MRRKKTENKNDMEQGFTTQNKEILVVEKKGELLALLLELYPEKRKKIKAVLRAGQIFVNGRSTTRFNAVVNPQARIEIHWERSAEGILSAAGITLLYEDRKLLVVNKPSGLLSVSTESGHEDTLYKFLNLYLHEQGKKERVYVLHRLDRDTSGVLIFVKDIHLRDQLQKNWSDLVKTRVYYGLVAGVPAKKKSVLDHFIFEDPHKNMQISIDPTRGKRAVTEYQVIQESDQFSLIRFSLETGRKNQIRIQMKQLGYPILGDRKYGSRQDPLKRLALHAQEISLQLSEGESLLTFQAAIPTEFFKLLHDGDVN